MTLFDYAVRISTAMRSPAQWVYSALVAAGLVLGGQQVLHAAERLTLGKDGEIDWLEGASSGADVETIIPEHRTFLDPNVTEVGIAPSNLIEFENGDHPEAILPRQVKEGTNVASQVFDFGGSITAPSVADIEGEEKRKILESLITEDPTGLALARKGQQRPRNHRQHRPRDSHRRPQHPLLSPQHGVFPILPRVPVGLSAEIQNPG